MPTTADHSPGVGRPKVSSRQLIEDAAAELFVENTYAGTTIDQITRRSGVSRATFFNYFGAKSDLLWFEVDRAIDSLREACAAASASGSLESVREVVLAVAGEFDENRVPLALTQSDVMGAGEDVANSGLLRVAAQADVYVDFFAARGARHRSDLLVRTAANALAGAVAAGWITWARAGIGRSPLTGYVAESVDVVFPGIVAAFAGVDRGNTF
ncbi:AcrR family transcriptional regulator [Conyzicola lurida]|uniref:AcrR family transcriptional regulator n=1 Tax=Conyzicola lurida TaxID=1172621 RepID=A0A841APM6_9MICO|nr:AcrR family transcriptional regulator [Conyzicola lurida]